jgi:hypothetical protein
VIDPVPHQLSLNRPCVVAPIGERIATGMAKHARVGLHFETEASRGSASIIRAKAASGARSDNGTELTSTAIRHWWQDQPIDWHYIAPGKPQQNAFAGSFIGRLRGPTQRAGPAPSSRGRRGAQAMQL